MNILNLLILGIKNFLLIFQMCKMTIFDYFVYFVQLFIIFYRFNVYRYY